MKLGTRMQPYLEAMGFTFKATPLVGSLGSDQAVGWMFDKIFHMADPDQVLRRAGIMRQHLRVLTSDDEITQAMDTRNDALIGTGYRFETPPGTDQAAVDWLAEQWEEQVDGVLRGAMQALPYGYSVLEAVYERQDDGRIGWASLAEKPFEWFIPRTDGSVLYRSHNNMYGEEVDPRKFFLTVRQQTYRNPYGEALYSRLYWPWFFRQQGWRFWVKWLERFGTPLLIGKGAGDAKELAKALSLAVQDAAVAVGTGTEVQIASAPGGADHFEKFDAVICRRIQKLVLGQTLTSDMTHAAGLGGTGAAKVHDEVRMDKRDADARMCVKTVQNIINALWGLNGFTGDAPNFVLQDDTGLEADRADRDSKLAQAGVCGFTEEYLTRVYDFEVGDIVEKDPNAQPASPFGGGGPGIQSEKKGPLQPNGKAPNDGKLPVGATAQEFQEWWHAKTRLGPISAADNSVVGPRFTAAQQVIEDRIAELRLTSPISQADIRECIMAASNPNDLANRLAKLFAGRSLHDFNEALERAMYAADILGYVHSQPPKQ